MYFLQKLATSSEFHTKHLSFQKIDLKPFTLCFLITIISYTIKVESAPLPVISDLVSMLIALLTEIWLQMKKSWTTLWKTLAYKFQTP